MSRLVPAIASLVLAVSPAAAIAQDGHHAHAPAASAQDEHDGHGHHHADFQSDRFHVRVDGQGPDIILIPGLSSSPEVWQSTVDHLGPNRRVHRIHIQGFGGAPVAGNGQGPVAAPVAEELARYIRENNLVRPAVIGHSMGGTIAMMLAARHPDSVGRVMVVDMVPFMGSMFAAPGTTLTSESVTPIGEQLHAGLVSLSPEAYDQRMTTQISASIRNESQRAGPIEDVRNSDQMVSANSFRELVVTDLRPELGQITAPTRVIYAVPNLPGMTAATTDSVYQTAFADLPGVSLKRIDDSAHFIMLDQPEAFYAEVDAFLSAE